jgi:membrane-associated phospholipid phosphatase
MPTPKIELLPIKRLFLLNFLHQNKLFLLLFVGLISVAFLILWRGEKGAPLLWLSENRNPILDVFFRFVTHLGDGWIFAPLLILAIFLQRWLYLFSFSALGLAVALTAGLAKYFFGAPRPKVYFEEVLQLPNLVSIVPNVELNNSWTSSFPSGHTLTAFAVFSFLAFLSPRQSLKIGFFALAFLVALSRMYLFQHFLSDVVAGAALGLILAIFVYFSHFFLDKRL